MRKSIKKIVIIAAVWLVISVIAAGVFWFLCTDIEPYSAGNDIAETTDFVYVTDNTNAGAGIWQLDTGGKTIRLLTKNDTDYLKDYRALLIDDLEDDIFVIFEKETVSEVKTTTTYFVAEFNEQMSPIFVTAPFSLPLELDVTGFSVSEEGMYITGISENRANAYVYYCDGEQLVSVSDLKLSDENRKKWESGQTLIAEYSMEGTAEGRYMAQAAFEDGLLSIRYDDSSPDSFTPADRLTELFDQREVSVSLRAKLSGINFSIFAIIFFAGTFLTVLVSIIFKARLRIVYVFTVYEALLLAALFTVFFIHTYSNRSAIEEAYVGFAGESISNAFDGYSFENLDTGIYDTDAYTYVAARFMRMAASSGSSSDATENVIIASEDGQCVISSDGRNLESVGYKYGADVLSVVTDAASSGTKSSIKKTWGGEKLIFIAEPLNSIGYSGYAGLIVASYEDINEELISDHSKMIIFLLIAFICGSILGGVYFFLESRDIKLLQTALFKIANGESDIAKPKTIGRDMNYMWNSIFEIHKNVLETNRVKLLTYEAYYRFAPKSVERILGLGSITEVESGDTVRLSGTIGLISTSGVKRQKSGELNRISEAFELMEELRKLYDGIFVSQDTLLTSVKLLFLSGNKDATSFGTDYIIKLREELKEKNTAVILHHTDFVYGVSGTKTQAGIYLSSPESDILLGYAGWFKELGLPLVVTGDVKEYEDPVCDMRYIGFVMAGEGSKIALYEVLDAETAAEHAAKVRNGDKFKEAVELFYNRDFYFARNIFSEILRETQSDGITRWYLFECEKYLNDAPPESFTGALNMENNR